MSKATINSTEEQQQQKEIKANMCDKITHLTKVVFTLNSKNEESEAMIASIISSYEKELYIIVRDSNNALNQLKKRVKELIQMNNCNTNDQLVAIESKYTSSLNSYLSKSKQITNEANNRLISMQQDYEEKTKKMVNDLSSIKSSNENRIKEMNKRFEDEKRQINESKGKEVGRLNQELMNLKMTSDKRIEAIESKLNIQIEKSKFEALKANNEKEVMIKEHNDHVSAYKKQIAINESNITIVNSQLANANNEISYFKEKDKEKNEKIKQCEIAMNDQSNKTQIKIKELIDDILNYKTQLHKYNQIEKTLLLKEESILQLEKEKQSALIKEKELNDSIASLNKALSHIQTKANEIESNNKKLLISIDDLNKEIEALNAKLSAKMDSDNKYRIQIESLKNDITTREKQLTQQYEVFISNLKKTNSDDKIEYEEQRRIMDNSHKGEIKSLNDTIQLLKEQVKKSQEDLILKDKQNEQMKESHQKEITSLKEGYANQIEEIKNKQTQSSNFLLEKANQQLKALKQSQLDDVCSLESKHREEMDRNSFQNSLNMNELQLKLDSQISLLKIENIQLREKMSEIEKEKQDQNSNNSSNYNKFKRTISAYPSKKITELENTISLLRKELLIRENEREKRKEEFKQTQHELFNKMKKEFNDAMTILQEKNRMLMNEISEFQVLITNRASSKEDITEYDRLKSMKEKEGINKSLEEVSKIDSMPLKRNGSDYIDNNINYFVKNPGFISSNKRTSILNGIKKLKIKNISNKSNSKKHQ